MLGSSVAGVVWVSALVWAHAAAAQPAPGGAAGAQGGQTQPTAGGQDHSQMTSPGWHVMQDGVLWITFTDQTGTRAARQTRSQNWWMLMAQRPVAGGTFTATLMLSAEPFTVGDRGYNELFQLGEASFGPDFFGTRTLLANVDRQHPHDFVMQAAVSWRRPIGSRAGLTFAGGPVGEASLGPVAFMHRASAAENPIAPLSHHTFDATHITNGVVTAAVDYGPWMVEGSIFQGREPDENRWDFMDPGALDSWSTRASFRSGGWFAQASYGFLEKPERLENVDVRRATASVSWTRERGDDFTAVSLIGGQNEREFSTLQALTLEATDRRGRLSIYGRFEAVDVESEHLFFPLVVHIPHPGELIDTVKVGTIGAVFDVLRIRGLALGIGGDIQWYGLTDRLRSFYGEPRTAHVYFRLRPRAPAMGRMFDMTMTSPGHNGR